MKYVVGRTVTVFIDSIVIEASSPQEAVELTAGYLDPITDPGGSLGWRIRHPDKHTALCEGCVSTNGRESFTQVFQADGDGEQMGDPLLEVEA